MAARQAVVADHVHREQVTAGSPGRDPRGPPDDVLVVIGARDGHDDPFPGLPGGGDAVFGPVSLQSLLNPVGQPEQGQLTQRCEVPRPEVVGERGIDPVRRVHIAMHHPPPQRLGRHVDQFDLVGPARNLVGQLLVLLHPGDLPGHVVERLQVLDVERGDDVDAGVEEFVDVLPSFLVPAAGHVGVGEFVHQRDLGMAGEHRVEIHLGEGHAPVGHGAPRHDRQPFGHRRGQLTAVRFQQPGNDVRATGATTLGLGEHRVGLADTGCGAR